jgi:hypothetical protein
LAFGSLKSDVRHTETALERKAERETVEAQYQSLLRELHMIRTLLERQSP